VVLVEEMEHLEVQVEVVVKLVLEGQEQLIKVLMVEMVVQHLLKQEEVVVVLLVLVLMVLLL